MGKDISRNINNEEEDKIEEKADKITKLGKKRRRKKQAIKDKI